MAAEAPLTAAFRTCDTVQHVFGGRCPLAGTTWAQVRCVTEAGMGWEQQVVLAGSRDGYDLTCLTLSLERAQCYAFCADTVTRNMIATQFLGLPPNASAYPTASA